MFHCELVLSGLLRIAVEFVVAAIAAAIEVEFVAAVVVIVAAASVLGDAVAGAGRFPAAVVVLVVENLILVAAAIKNTAVFDPETANNNISLPYLHLVLLWCMCYCCSALIANVWQ